MVRDIYQAQLSAATGGANATSGSSSSIGNGTELLTKALPLLVKEHEYWTTGNKAVVVEAADGSTHNFSRWAIVTRGRGGGGCWARGAGGRDQY